MASSSIQATVSAGHLAARSRFNKTSTFVAALAVALFGQLFVESSASAICDEPHTIWEVDNNSKTELVGYKTAWVANPITPKLAVGRTIEAHAEFSASVGADANLILLAFKEEFGIAVGGSMSKTVTEEYEGEKPAKGKLARLVVYAEARQFRTRKLALRSPCKYVPVGGWITVKAPVKTNVTIVREQYKKDSKASKSVGDRVNGEDGEVGSVEGDGEVEEVDLPYDLEGEVSEGEEGSEPAEPSDGSEPDTSSEVGVITRQADVLAEPRRLALLDRKGWATRARRMRSAIG